MSQPNFTDDLKPNFRNTPLFGFYRGVVLENKDRSIEEENKNYGRVHIHVPMLFDDETVGIWALPGNNPVGGRNTDSIGTNKDRNSGVQEYCGSSYIPPINSWLWVFFEGGDINRPYYSSGLDVKAHELPPEMVVQKGSKPEERWLVFRSPQGRVIMISDDPENCRIEITGKKRTSADNSESHVYGIDGNQKTILIDDREGKEKMLLKDEKGNFINIRTNANDIDIHANNIVRIFAGAGLYFHSPKVGLRGTSSVHMDSPNFNTNLWTGDSKPATDPNGERDE